MIRAYRPTDLEELLGVWARASAVAHPFLDQDFLERERRKIPDVYLPQAETWVWESEGRVVGFVSLLEQEVGALFVDPALHRLGIGRALVERARAARGALEVEVFEQNAMGRAFYAALGFEPVHVEVHAPTGFAMVRLRLAERDPMRPSLGADG